MNTKFKNFNIGFMEYLDGAPNLKDSPTYAAIIGSNNNGGFCTYTNKPDATYCSTVGIKTGDKTETNSKIKIGDDLHTFTCEGGNCCHSSTAQNVQSFHRVNGILQCHQSDSQNVPKPDKYMCTQQKTCEKIKNIADYYGPLAQSQPDCSEAPCDMHNTTVDIQGYTCSNPSTTCIRSLQKVKKINTCDLIKKNNGCHDLDGKLKTSGARDSGYCTLGTLKAPAGVEIQTYSPPPWNCIPSTWKDMCSTKGCRPFNGASPNDVHNTFESLGSDGINLGIDDLYMKMCSAKFRLTDKNKHACD